MTLRLKRPDQLLQNKYQHRCETGDVGRHKSADIIARQLPQRLCWRGIFVAANMRWKRGPERMSGGLIGKNKRTAHRHAFTLS